MLTKEAIHTFLRENGIREADTVLIHTSMRALGPVEGGCDGLIDSFRSYLTDGLFLVPTHTWHNVSAKQPIYDVRTTAPCIGALPTVAAFRRDGVRSLHPTHSVAAFGKRARSFVAGEETATSPCPVGGVWARLYDEDATILLLGVGLNRNTYIHAVDEMLALPDRLMPPVPLTVIDYDGTEYSLLFQKHGTTGSEFFENYRKPLEALVALRTARLGEAEVGIFSVRKGTEIIRMLWERADYNLCEEEKDIPTDYYLGDTDLFTKNGSDYITGLIAEAIQNGSRTATVCGNWEIDREVRLPSDFTLILEDCHLRMADGCFSNLFVNEHHGTEVGRTTEGTDRNITILGRGRAILDGGEYNGLSEKTQGKDGMPPIWKNNLLLFTNVDGFRITGLSCRNQRWWALNFVYCANGYLGQIDFCANDAAVDEEGNLYHGLKRSHYEDVLVKNADGIDLRQGCHHIVIEDITGFTEDDTIALTALNGNLERSFSVAGLPADLCHVTVRNIRSAAFCTNVRVLNQGDVMLHDILVDGVYDMGTDSPYMDRGIYAVRIGDNHLYGTRHATPEETYRITVRNVRGGGKYAVSLA